MKVLRILHIPGGAAWGGGESYVLTLVRYLPAVSLANSILNLNVLSTKGR
jgi:hypothetical protein